MVIDPRVWTMQPFAGTSGASLDTKPTPIQGAGGAGVYTTQGQQQQQQSAPDPYQAIIEAQRRYREESDRNFNLQKQQLEQEKQRIAIQRGTAEANAWYNREMVKLSQSKLEEDKRQFDLGSAEQRRQFDLKQQEIARQFDLTTVEGRRQYEQTYAENQRQFNANLALQAGMFDQRQAEDRRQFDLSYDLDNRKLGEDARQYDLSRADQREQFALTHGLDVRKLEEASRQYDLTRADERERFAQNLAENRRQFDVTASGYMDDGRATLEREKFGNQALFDWTSKAIELGSRPADWIKYKQMTSGVADNVGMIPGLAWTQGGQVGNTAFQGQAQANSLQNVLGQMGLQGQGGAGSGYVPLSGGGETRIDDPSGGRGFVPGEAPQMVSAQGQPAAQGQTNWAQQAASMIKPAGQLNLSAQERQIYDTANEFARNPQGAAPGWWEQQDPMTRELIRGAAQAQGHDWETAMSRYGRSRWGGGGSAAAA